MHCTLESKSTGLRIRTWQHGGFCKNRVFRCGCGRVFRIGDRERPLAPLTAAQAQALRPHIKQCIKAGRTSSDAIAADLKAGAEPDAIGGGEVEKYIVPGRVSVTRMGMAGSSSSGRAIDKPTSLPRPRGLPCLLYMRTATRACRCALPSCRRDRSGYLISRRIG